MRKTLLFAALSLAVACTGPKQSFVSENVSFAEGQIGKEIEVIEAHTDKVLSPIYLKPDDTVFYGGYKDWRSGFFPGSVWLLYELTGDQKYVPLARKYSEAIRDVQNLTTTHDVGFMSMCSFGNGLRLAGIEEYKPILVQTAKSLLTRFHESTGTLQSWEPSEKLDRKCPVIIDNMMNLELLFKVTEMTGDSTYYKVAVRHADRTLKEHFRPDGSAWHVVDYDPETGEVRKKETHQGAANESIWSRGQAWAIYGYTMAYRCTGDRRYIDQALKTFNRMKNHPNLAEDGIPYWDMEAPGIPDEPRDASSAAIIASALYEICTMDVENPAQYKEFADKLMTSLASPAYRAAPGTNGNFLLMHSVGSKPHNAEVNTALNYADYYFLEALCRKKNLEK